MEDSWDRDRLSRVHQAIANEGIGLVPPTLEVLDAAGKHRRSGERVNVIDSSHLGAATIHDEPIVSTDGLYRDLEGVDHVDPREFGPDS